MRPREQNVTWHGGWWPSSKSLNRLSPSAASQRARRWSSSKLGMRAGKKAQETARELVGLHLLLWIFAVLFEECVRRGDAGLVGLEFHRCGFFDKGWHFRGHL